MIITFSNGAAVDPKSISAMYPRKACAYWGPAILVDLQSDKRDRRGFAVEIATDEEMDVELRRAVDQWFNFLTGRTPDAKTGDA
jgi:hypothetical protein